MLGALGMAFALLLMAGTLGYLIVTMVKNIRGRSEGSLWKTFGLSITLCLLFFGKLAWSRHRTMAGVYGQSTAAPPVRHVR